MHVDRLHFELTLTGGTFRVVVFSWDGTAKRLTELGSYDQLSMEEARGVLDDVLQTLPPGSEYYMVDDTPCTQQVFF